MGKGLAYAAILLATLAMATVLWAGYTAHSDRKILEKLLRTRNQMLLQQAKQAISGRTGVIDPKREKLPIDLSPFTILGAFVETNYIELTVRNGSSLWRGGVRIFDGTNGFGKPITNGIYLFHK